MNRRELLKGIFLTCAAVGLPLKRMVPKASGFIDERDVEKIRKGRTIYASGGSLHIQRPGSPYDYIEMPKFKPVFTTGEYGDWETFATQAHHFTLCLDSFGVSASKVRESFEELTRVLDA